MKDCAYKKVCKGICDSPSSCIKHSKTTDEYWAEIQEAMVAKGRLERIRHYLSTNPKNIRTDIIQKWATLQGMIVDDN